MILEDRCYNTRTEYEDLECSPFQCFHKLKGWTIGLNFRNGQYNLVIDGVKYEEMAEALPRERSALARTAMIMKMVGPKKTAKFGLLRSGEYIGASVLLNLHTKFSKL